jgi:HEAT repeat protein
MPTPIPNIWQMQQQSNADALVEALRHPDASVRRRAAGSLRAIGAWHTLPAIESALAVESDWQAHAAMSAAIQYLDHDVHIEQMVKAKDLRGLSKMLSSSQIEDVLIAASALGGLADRRAVEPLIVLFRNPLAPSKARLAAAEALLKLESAPAVVTLLGALRRDDWQARRNAAAVLGQLQASWAVEPLIVALNDPMPVVRKTASAALRRIGTSEAMSAATKFDEANRRSETRPLPANILEAVQAETDKLNGVSATKTDNTAAAQSAAPSNGTGLLPPLPSVPAISIAEDVPPPTAPVTIPATVPAATVALLEPETPKPSAPDLTAPVPPSNPPPATNT